jgi:hypothetical protein
VGDIITISNSVLDMGSRGPFKICDFSRGKIIYGVRETDVIESEAHMILARQRGTNMEALSGGWYKLWVKRNPTDTAELYKTILDRESPSNKMDEYPHILTGRSTIPMNQIPGNEDTKADAEWRRLVDLPYFPKRKAHALTGESFELGEGICCFICNQEIKKVKLSGKQQESLPNNCLYHATASFECTREQTTKFQNHSDQHQPQPQP